MLFGEFLNNLAPILGEKTDGETIAKLQQIKELATLEVPDTWATKTGSLMTYESAINNEKVRNHYYATMANGMDAEIERQWQSYGLDEEAIAELKGEEKLTKRVVKTLAKVKELTEKKAGAKPSDKKEYEEQIAKLHADLKAAGEQKARELEANNAQWYDRLKNIEIEKVLGQKEYGVDLSKDVLIQTANNLIAKKLQDKKLKVVYSADNNSIGLKTESGLDHFENNSPVSYEAFADSVLAENKLLKVKGEPAKAPTMTVVTTGNGQGNHGNSASMDAEIARMEATMVK